MCCSRIGTAQRERATERINGHCPTRQHKKDGDRNDRPRPYAMIRPRACPAPVIGSYGVTPPPTSITFRANVYFGCTKTGGFLCEQDAIRKGCKPAREWAVGAPGAARRNDMQNGALCRTGEGGRREC
jgi:hypothetical protein